MTRHGFVSAAIGLIAMAFFHAPKTATKWNRWKVGTIYMSAPDAGESSVNFLSRLQQDPRNLEFSVGGGREAEISQAGDLGRTSD
jgi:hypothetical protein